MTGADNQDAGPARAWAPEQPPAGRAAGPLSPGQLEELARANARAGTLLRARRLASFNGWTLALCALLCLPFALLDISALPIGVCLGAVAWTEFRGGRLLREYDLRAPLILGINQLVLLGLVVCYCWWRIAQTLAGPDLTAELLGSDPVLKDILDNGAGSDMKLMVDSMGELYRTVLIAMYVAVMAASALFQGLCALYYFGRRKHLRAYLEQTPPWIMEIQRQG